MVKSMSQLATIHRNFLDIETCNRHADRMDEYRHGSCRDDIQSPGSFARYGLNWDLLEECHEKVEEAFGLELIPAYEYSRIYVTGNDLFRHKDRPACQHSVTINLRNQGDPWEFHWEGGSCLMLPGDAVVYHGCEVEHWREENKGLEVYQTFLHYVDANGPYAHKGNEYMRHDAHKGVADQTGMG